MVRLFCESGDLRPAIRTLGRFAVPVIVSLGALLAFGAIGYRTIEGWSFAESLYMTAITISTVGFSEVHPLSHAGRLFTVLLILIGLLTVSLIGAHSARMLIDSEIKSILGRKKMKKGIAELKGHYVVCGYGRIGGTICAELQQAGIPFVIIEKDEGLVEQAEAEGHRVLKGDATSDAVLKEAGIDRAAGAIAVLNSDAHNLFISLAAREMNPTIKIIARGEEPGIESRLLRAGADVVVSPLKLGGRRIAHMLLDDLRPPEQHALHAPGAVMLQQIRHMESTQRTVDDLLHECRALLAVAVQREDGRTEMMPSSTSVLNPNDVLFVCRSGQAAPSSEVV
jgi:voltage-gated potassium channel